MAAKYWVGGTGNLDGVTTTHISDSSGGGGGAVYPAAGDTLTFDGASGGGTVTVTATVTMTSWTSSAHTGTIDTNGQTVNLSSGWTNSGTATRTVTLGASAINIGAVWSWNTTTNLTFNAGTSTITASNMVANVFAGGGQTYATVVLNSFANLTSGISGTNTFGTLTINGTASPASLMAFYANQTVTGTLTIAGANSTTQRIFLGSSAKGTARTITAATVVVTNADFQDIVGAGAGLWEGALGSELIPTAADRDFSSDTGHWVSTNGSWIFIASGVLRFSGAAQTHGMYLPSAYNGGIIVGKRYAVTYTVSNYSSGGVGLYNPGDNPTPHTANGTYTDYMSLGQNQIYFAASAAGTTLDIDNVSVKEVTEVFGNCGGNSGIGFSAGITCYWQHGASASYNWSDSTRWFLATNGGGGAGRVPLPQDAARFDANSFAAGSKTVVQDMSRIGAADWTGVTNTPTWTTSTAASFFGSITLVAGMTLTASAQTYTYEGRGSSVLTSAGNSWTKSMDITAPGGTLTLGDAFLTSSAIALNNGTFVSTTFNVTMSAFASNNSNTRAISMGSGNWTLTGANGTLWNVGTTTGMTLTAGTSKIYFSAALGSTVSFWGGTGLTYYNLENATSGAFALNFISTNTFNNITIAAGRTVKFTAATTTTFNSLTWLGTRALPITIDTITAATHNLTHTGTGPIQVRYCSIKNSTGSGAQLIAHVSTNVSGNTTWTFPSAVFWVGGTGNWSDAATHWAATSGGAAGAGNLPTALLDAVFDDQSSGAGYTVTIDATTKLCNDLIFQAPATGNVTWAGSTQITISGSLSKYSGLVETYTGLLLFGATSGIKTITSAGVGWNAMLQINGPGVTFWLEDDLTMVRSTGTGIAMILSNGTFAPNGKTFTINTTSNGIQAIDGAWTFYNLTFTGTAAKTTGFSLSGNITVSNILTVTGNSDINRALVCSNTKGTARTITAAAIVISNVDFQDILGVGALTALSTGVGGWGEGLTVAPNGNVYAAAYGGDIYMQTGGTGTFAPLSQTNRNWRGMCAAPNGNIYAVVPGSDIYMQTAGAGAFTALSQGAVNWYGMAAAANGDIYACVSGGDIYKRTAGAGAFNPLGETSRIWSGMTVAPNGDVYACVAGSGDIYKQTNGSGAFTALSQTARDWRGMASTAAGDIYAVAYHGVTGNVYRLVGGVFVSIAVSRAYVSVAATPSGSVYSAVYSGAPDIYKSWQLQSITGKSGDCGGNSGMTLTPAATQYWFHGASASYNWSDSTRWFLATGGTGGAGRVPLPQDTARFDSGSFAAGSKVVSQDMPRFGSVNWTGATNTPTWTWTSGNSFFGSLTLISGMTFNAAAVIYEGRGASTVVSAGQTFGTSVNFTISCVGGSMTMNDAFTLLGYGALTVVSGTFNSNGFTLSVGLLQGYSNTLPGSFVFGSSLVLVTNGALPDTIFIASPTTVVAGTSTIRFTGNVTTSTRLRLGSGYQWNNLHIASTGAGYVEFTNGSTFNDIKIDPGRTVKFTAATTTTFNSLTWLGTRALPITVTSITAATHTLTHSGTGPVQVRYCTISYSTASGSGMEAHVSTDGGSNTVWTFPVAKYWIGGTGNWSDTTHWSTTSGGAGSAGEPTTAQDAVFDDNSGAAPTVTLDAGTRTCYDLIVQAPTSGVLTLAGTGTFNVYGSVSIYAAMLYSPTGYTNCLGTGTRVLTCDQTARTTRFSITGASSSWYLGSNFQGFYLLGGTNASSIDTNGFNITYTQSYNWSGTGSANYRSGTHAVNGNCDLRVTGTFTGDNATFTAVGGNVFYSPATGHMMSLTLASNEFISSGCTFGNLTLTGGLSGGGLPITGNITCTGNFAVSGSNETARAAAWSAYVGSPITISAATITGMQWCTLRGIIAAGASAPWNLSAIPGLASDGGGNQNITFAAPITVYWVGNAGSATSSAKWASTSGGSGGTARVPLLQDTARFDANSVTIGAQTILFDLNNSGNIDTTGVLNTPTLQFYYNMGIFGTSSKFVGVNFLTYGTGYPILFNNWSQLSLDWGGATAIGTKVGLQIMRRASVRLLSNLTITGGFRLFYGGIFDGNGFNVSVVSNAFYAGVYAAQDSSITFGSGTWTINNDTTDVANLMFLDTTLATVNATGSTIRFVSALTQNGLIVVNKVGVVFNNISIETTGAFDTRFTGQSFTANNIHIDASAAARTVKFTSSTNTTVTTMTRNAGTNIITLDTTTGTGTFTLTKAGGGRIHLDYMSITRSTGAPGASTWYATNSTNGGTNTNWNFVAGYSSNGGAGGAGVASSISGAAVTYGSGGGGGANG